MSDNWLITLKSTFQSEWLGLPPKLSHQVLNKISLLVKDPVPDGKIKKQLKHFEGKICRLRCGDYRIFYTFEEPYVSLLSLRKRDERTYNKSSIKPEQLGGLDYDMEEPYEKQTFSGRTSATQGKVCEKTKLPEPITEEMLNRLQISVVLHPRLVRIKTREDLYECPGLSDDVILRIDEFLFERPIEEIMEQPDFVAQEISDLLRFKDGDLLGFLMKLSPEQERYVKWDHSQMGPTLLAGGPGSGKSTIALHRVHTFLQTFTEIKNPRILFTTYTNALINYSRQLLDQFLGDSAGCVKVCTADQIAYEIVKKIDGPPDILSSDETLELFRKALRQLPSGGSSLFRRKERRSLEKIGVEYLLEEIEEILEGLDLKTVEQYLDNPREGRRVELDEQQRKEIWKLRGLFYGLLKKRGKWNWGLLRLRASHLTTNNTLGEFYDAIIVDEAQDLPVTSLRILVALCKNPSRMFITADANQSIYRNGFSWTEVHKAFDFCAIDGTLNSNHRSTQEIDEAARDYLFKIGLKDHDTGISYAHTGALPAVRWVKTKDEELDLISQFLNAATKHLRLNMASCVVIAPFNQVGQRIADGLKKRGLPVEFMSGKHLDISKPTVKVITLKSAKGLEFPIVALGGFVGVGYPNLPDNLSPTARDEWIGREGRTLFVGMTRAMRALFIVAPHNARGLLSPEKFHRDYWNIE